MSVRTTAMTHHLDLFTSDPVKALEIIRIPPLTEDELFAEFADAAGVFTDRMVRNYVYYYKVCVCSKCIATDSNYCTWCGVEVRDNPIKMFDVTHSIIDKWPYRIEDRVTQIGRIFKE